MHFLMLNLFMFSIVSILNLKRKSTCQIPVKHTNMHIDESNIMQDLTMNIIKVIKTCYD